MSLEKQFLDPGNQWRGKPFWSWNGKLAHDELLRQIDVLKEMEFGGFFMHSRTGLETESLGDDWFDQINTCADDAESIGLEAWLYDEDRWPSGLAGAITYHVAVPENATRLRLPDMGAVCAKVNNHVLGWDSFEADLIDCGDTVDVELVLTRRNTFGPLHDGVEGRIHNGPDHWLTEGIGFSPDCILIPSGILKPVVCS